MFTTICSKAFDFDFECMGKVPPIVRKFGEPNFVMQLSTFEIVLCKQLKINVVKVQFTNIMFSKAKT